MTQFLDTHVDKSLGATGTWTDIDLSSDIPAGATGAIIWVRNTNASNAYKFGLRKKGSGDDRYYDAKSASHQHFIIGVDSNRKIQGKIENAAVDFKLIGYTEADATFLTNGVDKSLYQYGSWEDLDLSAQLPVGAVAAVFEIVNTSASLRMWGLRKKGSSDEFYKDAIGESHLTFIVGVDSNRKCQGKIEGSSVDFFLIGYLTQGAAETNAIDRSLGSTGAYIDITESGAPAGSTGVFGFMALAATGWTYAVRKNGLSDDYYHSPSGKMVPIYIGIDTNKKWEGKIASTSEDFYTLGYFASGVETKTKASSVGLTILETRTKASSVGLSIEETKTKASSVGLTVVERQTKASSVGLSITEQQTKESSVGLTVMGSGVTTFLDTPVDKSLGATGAWTDIDLSSDIPATGTGAIIRVENTADSWKKFGLRKKGSTDDRYGEAEAYDQGYHIIAIDENQKIQGKIESTEVDFKLIGYTAGDAVFFTNGINKSLSQSGSWIDMDLSANIPTGAIAAIFEAHNTAVAPKSWDLRKKGSSDDRYEDICTTRCNTYVVAIDENRKCQGKIETTELDFYLMGYLILGTMETNGIDRSLGSTGSFTDITETNAPAGCTGVIVDYLTTQMTQKYAARKNGSSEDTYLAPEARKCMFYVPIDADKKWEGKIEHLANDWFTVGYFAPGVVVKTKESSVGLSVQETNTKASSVGLSVQETPTKTSSIGLRIVERQTKASSAGLIIVERQTKASSVGLSVKEERGNVSTLGLSIVERITKESSVGLSVTGTNVKASSVGLSIQESLTKASSVGISIVDTKTKSSSAGLRIVDRNIKESSASLTVKATYTKDSTVGLSIISAQTKASSVGMTISGSNTKESSVGLTVYESVLKKGLFYGKLGDTILETVEPESFRISEEINKIPSFEFEVANSEANRTAIAANPTALFKIYWQHHGLNTHIFTGIINADGIEYVSLTNIRITGFASYVKLGWPLYKHLDSEDAEPVNKVFSYQGTYTDYTTEANNSTTNDVILGLDDVNYCLYVGEANPFWGLQIKYSTKGVPANAVIVIEFSKGSGVWATLDVLDTTNAFTEDAGTYDFIIAHPPSDWARNTVNGVSKFWLRWRVVSGAYTTSPKLDQIHTVNVDVYRVFYLATSARAILLDVLDGTEYSMDATDTCPEDEINILAEYESPLRVIAAIPAALTWTDGNGSKKAYQWWIDEAKKVHMKQKRGTTHPDDITGDLTIFNNLLDYFNISNRLIGFAKRDGLSQIRAIVENTASQTTHALREFPVPKTDIGKYITLKEGLEKDMAISKDPMQRIKGSVTTEFWGGRGYEVGDTVTLHQGEWVVEEGEFQIVKVDIGPVLTQLNLGISREHLEGLKSNLKRTFDISNVQMHGSTSLLTAGPETSNYERKTGGEVFSSKLKIEIPSEVTKTHKVLLSWTIGKYRASVSENSNDVPSHDHGGSALIGGEISADTTTDNGGFTPDVSLDGLHTPVVTDGLHKHKLKGAISYAFDTKAGRLVTSDEVAGTRHRHTKGATGAEDSRSNVVYNLIDGCTCPDCGLPGSTGVKTQQKKAMADAYHVHSNTSYFTGYTEPNMSVYVTSEEDFFCGVQWIEIDIYSDEESPVHAHTGTEVVKHDHVGVAEEDHMHETNGVPGHIDHGITAETSYTVSTNYGIHEEAAGTVLELIVNSEKVGEYTGEQTEIRIDGYLTSGANTIEIQPIATETGKKGSATISASGILFVEPKKF